MKPSTSLWDIIPPEARPASSYWHLEYLPKLACFRKTAFIRKIFLSMADVALMLLLILHYVTFIHGFNPVCCIGQYVT